MDELHKDGHNPRLPVDIQPNIGLDSDIRSSVVDLLNVTLADVVVLTIKTRCAYWNARGGDFHYFHTLLENQYQLLNNACEVIAERARMLGGFAVCSLEEYAQLSRLEGQPGEVPDILRLLADHETTIRSLREDVRKCTEEFEDEGTFELLVSVMRMHEKITWKLRSCIEVDLLKEKKYAA